MVSRIMVKNVENLTLAELRREQEILPVWIRDVNAPKQARMREISKEIERRERQEGEIASDANPA